jgi:hypothetical protein
MLASTFHDVAYPIEFMESWLNDLLDSFLGIKHKFTLNIENMLPTIYLDFMRLICSYHSNIVQGVLDGAKYSTFDWLFNNELNTKLIEKNHGVIGGLILTHLLAIRQGFARSDNPWTFLYDHMPACHAIAIHQLPSISIDFCKHPFAYLLVLCDEIQDWGRPILAPSPRHRGVPPTLGGKKKDHFGLYHGSSLMSWTTAKSSSLVVRILRSTVWTAISELESKVDKKRG